jgi:hypothetical protein
MLSSQGRLNLLRKEPSRSPHQVEAWLLCVMSAGGLQEIGNLLDAFSPAKCANYFRAAGYAV